MGWQKRLDRNNASHQDAKVPSREKRETWEKGGESGRQHIVLRSGKNQGNSRSSKCRRTEGEEVWGRGLWRRDEEMWRETVSTV